MGHRIAAFLAVLTPAVALAQPLLCPTTPASGRCDAYHFHVIMFRPDTKGFAELYGINQFASQPACDRMREAQMTRNLAVVEHIKRTQNDQQYQPDRFGPCHCDMTIDKTSPNYLTDLQRTAQVRLAEEIRQRVRERLMDTNLTTDSDLIRGLAASPPPNNLLGGPKLASLPSRQVAASTTNPADELKMTRTVETTGPAIASLDLPLVEVAAVGAVPAAVQSNGTSAAKADEGTAAADEAADSFVGVETQRIQEVLKASNAVADEALKAKILEACMQRIQLLSNLRSLIQGSGAHSRLAIAARNAKSDPDRLALVTKLFGADVAPHWAPKDASAVLLAPAPDDAEKVLRDTSGKFNDQQKRRALYDLLARTQPTEDQQLWLSTVVDTLLQS